MSNLDQIDYPADAILRAAGVEPNKEKVGAAGGAYRPSEPAHFNGCYWATRSSRFKRDEFGVQFKGTASEAFRVELELNGFIDRDQGKSGGKATFVRKIPQLSDGSIDIAAIQEAKRSLDSIFNTPPSKLPQVASSETPVERRNFATELRNSLPFFIDLELPERSIEPAREISF
jgi:hypothetical protein